MNKILNRLIEYRKAKGLFQKQMADKLGIAQVNYSKIETGKTELTLDRLFKIADILEISVIELINPDFNPANFSKELQEENEKLKRQIEDLKESAKKDSQIVDYSNRYNISIKKAMRMSLYTSLGFVENVIKDTYDSENEREIRLKYLNYFATNFKKNLIELGVFVDSEFESFES